MLLVPALNIVLFLMTAKVSTALQRMRSTCHLLEQSHILKGALHPSGKAFLKATCVLGLTGHPIPENTGEEVFFILYLKKLMA